MFREKFLRWDCSLARIGRIAILFSLILLDLNFLAISGTFLVNNLTVSETKTVVFASGWDGDDGWPTKLNAYIIAYVSYCPITLRQNLRGFHTDWYLDPSAWELIKEIDEPAYQNIVLVGHGSREGFTTKDGGISSLWITHFGIKKKKGELVQHTCGSSLWPIISLRETLLEDVTKGYYFSYNVGHFENGLRAYIELGREVLRIIQSNQHPQNFLLGVSHS